MFISRHITCRASSRIASSFNNKRLYYRSITTTTVTPTEKPLPPQTLTEHPDGPKLGSLHSYKIFLTEGQKVKWCSCGLSKNQPWCDNSHVGSKFEPLVFTAPESKIYSMCLCKYTKKSPVCDGIHKQFIGYTKPIKTTNPTPNPPPPDFNGV